MKVIGTTHEGFIISCTHREIANLNGLRDFSDFLHTERPTIGTEFNIALLTDRIKQAIDLNHQNKEIKHYLESMLKASNNLERLFTNTLTQPTQTKDE